MRKRLFEPTFFPVCDSLVKNILREKYNKQHIRVLTLKLPHDMLVLKGYYTEHEIH
jgi:hypothetical protein